MDDDAPITGDELPERQLAKLRPAIPGYDLIESIGVGAQATVYRAIDRSTGIIVAVKVFHGGPMADEDTRERYAREVRALEAIDHPNVVRMRSHDKSPAGFDFLVMDYVNGPNLAEFLEEIRSGRRKLEDPAELLKMFRKICSGMQAAHLWGIVHRDLSPDNIRIDKDGEPKVVDFGMARTAFDRHFRVNPRDPSLNMFLGKPAYASPEYLRGMPPDARSDVYALGVMLYQILTNGRFPYSLEGSAHEFASRVISAEPVPPSKRVAAKDSKRPQIGEPKPALKAPLVNEAIEQVVLKALAKDPIQRYQSAGELDEEIGRYLAGSPTVAMLKHLQERAKTIRRWGWRGVASAAAIALVATIAYRSRHGHSAVPPSAGVIPVLVTPHGAASSAVESSTSSPTTIAARRSDMSAWSTPRRVPPQVVGRFSGFPGAVGELSFDPHGQWVRAATDADVGPAMVWDLADSRTILRQDQAARIMEFSPDGQWSFLPGVLLNLKTGKRSEIGSEIAGTRGRFSADGSRFAGAGTVENNGVRVYRVSDGARVFDQRPFFPAWLRGCSLDLSPDGKRVAAAGGADSGPGDRGIQIWNVDTGQEFPRVQWRGGAKIKIRFSSDGGRLYAAQASVVKVFDVESGRMLQSFRLPGTGVAAHHGELLRNGEKMVVACWNQAYSVSIWDASTGIQLAEKQLDPDWATPPVFSDDGRRMLTADSRGIVIAWDMSQITPIRQCTTKLPGHIKSLAISLDCTLGAAGDDGGNICVWRLK